MGPRRFLGVALLLLVPAVSIGYESMPAPKAAKAWLGSWKTTQGTFGFSALTGCYTGPDLVAPTCGVTGTWDQPGEKGSVPIHGTIYLGPKYHGEVFQGCFDLPDLTPGDHCTFNSGGQISLDRMGTRITEGYWKACGLGANCRNHHPITGRKLSGGGGCSASRATAIAAACGTEEIDFSVTVDGFPDKPDEKDLPDDLADVQIQSHGTTLTGSAGSGFRVEGKLRMLLTYISPIVTPHVKEERYTIKLSGEARYINENGYRKVVALGKVDTPSNRRDCADEARVEVRLTVHGDKRALAFDGVDGRANQCLSTKTVIWGPRRVKKASIGG